MPKEKNKALNPYYLELLKYMVVYKLKNRLALNLTSSDRDELVKAINEYNTKDSLNRIFSQGVKRRQNFNKSNLQGLCNYVGYDDWDDFILKENRIWANDLDEKLYNDLNSDIKKKIHQSIFVRILQEVELKIIEGIKEFFKAHIIDDVNVENRLSTAFNIFNLCTEYIAQSTNDTQLVVIYKVAENIDEDRYFLEGFSIPEIFIREINIALSEGVQKEQIDNSIEQLNSPLKKEIMKLYRNGSCDDDICKFLNIKGISITAFEITDIRISTIEDIFNQLKQKQDENLLFKN